MTTAPLGPFRVAMPRVAARVAACLAAWITACATVALPPEHPAHVVGPDAASRADLAAAVATMLGRPVRLAPDALAGNDTLVVDRIVARDESGVPLDGRSTGRPERFRLLTDGRDCVLVREADGRRLRLAATRCEAAAQP